MKMNRKGIAFIAVLSVISVLIIFAAAFMNRTVSRNKISLVLRTYTEAFNLAEAGLDKAIVWFREQASPPTGNRTNPWGGVQSLGNGTYSVAITDLGAVGTNTGVRRYRVVSTGTVAGMSRSLTNYIQVDNYARYIWFTDRETFGGTTVWFWSGDHLNGPTHTNAHYNIYKNPVFAGEVGSVDDYIRFYNNGNNINLNATSNSPYDEPEFNQGVKFGAEATTMPTQALSLRAAASSSGMWLKGDSTIVFNSNGTITVTNSKAKWNNYTTSIPSNGAIFVSGGDLTISGTVNGNVTVGSSQDVIIPNNIVYASNPRTNPNSDDMLGIIAESDVMVSSGAPTNVEIDACIMALGTSFMLQNYSSVSAKGTLTVYGGIIQDERGPVGTFNGTTGQKVSGYSKDYSYDPRLLSTPPPFMPTTGDYITLSWQEN